MTGTHELSHRGWLRYTARRTWFAVALAATISYACQGDDVGRDGDLVGGSCKGDRDCVERCERGGDFPGGTCTVQCHDDRDCPDSTYCVEARGGVCLLACSVDDDCRDHYSCRDRDREGRGGRAAVCVD